MAGGLSSMLVIWRCGCPIHAFAPTALMLFTGPAPFGSERCCETRIAPLSLFQGDESNDFSYIVPLCSRIRKYALVRMDGPVLTFLYVAVGAVITFRSLPARFEGEQWTLQPTSPRS